MYACIYIHIYATHETAIYIYQHNSSNWVSHITIRMGYKHTFCEAAVCTQKCCTTLISINYINTLTFGCQVFCQTCVSVGYDKLLFHYIYTACPSRYRTRHFFNSSNTNEDIATKFEQEYVRCARNEKECVCSAPNYCDTEQRSAS